MTKNGERKLRYPGNDPENGPAEWHRFENGQWRSEREMREATYNWRKRKRYELLSSYDIVYLAWLQGQEDAVYRRPSRAQTMYAAGRRRDEYERGYNGR